MKYLILSDTHLGCTEEDKLSKLQLLLMQHKDDQIIWCGDIIDRLVYEDSYITYGNFVRPQDTVIFGNHDYDSNLKLFTQLNIIEDDSNKDTKTKKIFITHGDLVDFGLGFKLLQDLSFSLICKLLKHKLYKLAALATLLRTLNPFKRWSIQDTYTFYKVLIDLSDDDINAYHKNNIKFKTIISYIITLIKLLYTKYQYNEDRSYKIAEQTYLDVLRYNDKFFGLFTVSPKVLLERTLLMYPECVDSDVIIIGHIHHSCNQIIKADNGKEYQLIVLGAWIGNVTPSYVTIDTSKYPNSLEVIQVE